MKARWIYIYLECRYIIIRGFSWLLIVINTLLTLEELQDRESKKVYSASRIRVSQDNTRNHPKKKDHSQKLIKFNKRSFLEYFK